MRKRSFALLLSIILLLGVCMPLPSFAAAQKITAKLSAASFELGKSVKLSYTLSKKATAKVSILTAGGKLVAQYTHKSVAAKKVKTMTWSGKTTKGNGIGLASGKSVPAGKYTLRIESAGARKSLKVTVKPKMVKVKSVKLSPSKLTVAEKASAALTATISPSTATNKGLTWKSSAPKVASVSSKGVVKGIKAGKAKITVTTKDGKKTASCTVTVVKASSVTPTKNPSATPTKKPTAAPTKASSTTPTKNPAATPTKKPTATPTKKPTTTPTKAPTPAPSGEPRGNSVGNSMQHSQAALGGGKLYFTRMGKGDFEQGIYMMDAAPGAGSKAQLLVPGTNFLELNFIDGYLYYNNGSSFWRVKPGGTPQRIIDDFILYVNIVGGRIYFKSITQNDGMLVSTKLDGSDRKVLYTGEVGAINAHSNIIYFVNYNDGAKPYSIKPDGTGLKKVNDIPMLYPIFADNGWIYYNDGVTNKGLYMVKYDGTGKKTISLSGGAPNLMNGFVYYTAGDGEWIHRANLDGAVAERFASGCTNDEYSFAIFDNFIASTPYSNASGVSAVYCISAKKNETLPVVEYVDVEVVSLLDLLTYASLKGLDFVRGGTVSAIIRADKTGFANIRYGFGLTEKVLVSVEAGKTYMFTVGVSDTGSVGQVEQKFFAVSGDGVTAKVGDRLLTYYTATLRYGTPTFVPI